MDDARADKSRLNGEGGGKLAVADVFEARLVAVDADRDQRVLGIGASLARALRHCIAAPEHQVELGVLLEPVLGGRVAGGAVPLSVLFGVELDVGILLERVLEPARPFVRVGSRLAVEDRDLALEVTVLRLEQFRGLFAAQLAALPLVVAHIGDDVPLDRGDLVVDPDGDIGVVGLLDDLVQCLRIDTTDRDRGGMLLNHVLRQADLARVVVFLLRRLVDQLRPRQLFGLVGRALGQLVVELAGLCRREDRHLLTAPAGSAGAAGSWPRGRIIRTVVTASDPHPHQKR